MNRVLLLAVSFAVVGCISTPQPEPSPEEVYRIYSLVIQHQRETAVRGSAPHAYVINCLEEPYENACSSDSAATPREAVEALMTAEPIYFGFCRIHQRGDDCPGVPSDSMRYIRIYGVSFGERGGNTVVMVDVVSRPGIIGAYGSIVSTCRYEFRWVKDRYRLATDNSYTC